MLSFDYLQHGLITNFTSLLRQHSTTDFFTINQGIPSTLYSLGSPVYKDECFQLVEAYLWASPTCDLPVHCGMVYKITISDKFYGTSVDLCYGLGHDLKSNHKTYALSDLVSFKPEVSLFFINDFPETFRVFHPFNDGYVTIRDDRSFCFTSDYCSYYSHIVKTSRNKDFHPTFFYRVDEFGLYVNLPPDNFHTHCSEKCFPSLSELVLSLPISYGHSYTGISSPDCRDNFIQHCSLFVEGPIQGGEGCYLPTSVEKTSTPTTIGLPSEVYKIPFRTTVCPDLVTRSILIPKHTIALNPFTKIYSGFLKLLSGVITQAFDLIVPLILRIVESIVKYLNSPVFISALEDILISLSNLILRVISFLIYTIVSNTPFVVWTLAYFLAYYKFSDHVIAFWLSILALPLITTLNSPLSSK
jgi:DNA-binding MltR family transcriptional regulator